ncbi:parvulin-like peptidyl-prolyl isomerase [Cylindrospermum stagnale PCC 7417]|uniref:peptidylprolyl isomerase n=1 Tax=Cylindrospermum stagnale PCC 7417 TaxID=56107 RepID=K9X3Z0_9NOST|nr:peptidylprolyl isomerase [Cylindrospermum stagnale]AFZ27375.1 parvulin-like peptidyl-prolyl isomerase [Cylindrospermum stagnale PCC 7417]
MNNLSNIIVEPEEIINFLKSKMDFKEVYQNVLFQRIIFHVAQERGITVTAEEIEAQANNMRRNKRLEKAADTMAWLADQLITPEDWEAGIHASLLSQKLAEFLFAQEVKKVFFQNRLEFEEVVLYQIIVSYEKFAQELFYQIEEGEISFYHAAHLYDIDEHRRYKCGYEGKIYRFALQPDIAAVVFSTPAKQLIPPLKTDQGYHLFLVDEFLPAELTSERYQEILNNMFQRWLASELDSLLNLSLQDKV